MPGTSSVTVTPAAGTVRVVQLTDTHLCREAGGTLLAMDTDHSLGEVIERVRREREGIDVLLVDTAGRLQNKKDLMVELQKVVRVIKKKDGQQALEQRTEPIDLFRLVDGT